jgi:hypothetical protein
MWANLRISADEHDLLADAIRFANLNLAGGDAACSGYPGNAARDFEQAALDRNGKFKASHAAAGDPDVGIGGIDDLGSSPHEAEQHAALKDHQEDSAHDAQHGYHKAHAVMRDVEPCQPNRFLQ